MVVWGWYWNHCGHAYNIPYGDRNHIRCIFRGQPDDQGCTKAWIHNGRAHNICCSVGSRWDLNSKNHVRRPLDTPWGHWHASYHLQTTWLISDLLRVVSVVDDDALRVLFDLWDLLTRGRSTTRKCMVQSIIGCWFSVDQLWLSWLVFGFWFGFSLNLFSFHAHGPRFGSHPNS